MENLGTGTSQWGKHGRSNDTKRREKKKQIKWNYNGTDYFVRSDLGEYSGARKGQIYTFGVPRIIFTKQLRIAIKQDGRTPPKNLTYLFLSSDWNLEPARMNTWTMMILISMTMMIIFLIYHVNSDLNKMETCKDMYLEYLHINHSWNLIKKIN